MTAKGRETYLSIPLESTYQSAWKAAPEEMRIAVETGVMPESDDETA